MALVIMLKPITVRLQDHDPAWLDQARELGDKLAELLGDNLIQAHHVGSTSIPGIVAKPILDLLPEVRSLNVLGEQRNELERVGFTWHGEFGLSGRRYCKLDDAVTGQRIAQLHCYQTGSAEIIRHLAFRDYLRSHPDLATEYERVKMECRDRHHEDSHQYGDCKSSWIVEIEKQALLWFEKR